VLIEGRWPGLRSAMGKTALPCVHGAHFRRTCAPLSHQIATLGVRRCAAVLRCVRSIVIMMCIPPPPNCHFGSAAVSGGAPPVFAVFIFIMTLHHSHTKFATLGVRPVCGGGPVRARCQLLMVKLSPPAGSKRARIIKLIRRDGWRAPPIDPRHPMVLLWFFLLQRHLHSMPYAQSQATTHICLLLFNGYYSMFLQIVTTIK
jgi:hypothetical protein